jgi:hypothetical protein
MEVCWVYQQILRTIDLKPGKSAIKNCYYIPQVRR